MEGSDGAGSEVGVEVNTEEEDKLWRVLTGNLHDLPPLSSKIVRIFTSSTFTGKVVKQLFYPPPPPLSYNNFMLCVLFRNIFVVVNFVMIFNVELFPNKMQDILLARQLYM